MNDPTAVPTDALDSWRQMISRRDLLKVGSMGLAASTFPAFGTDADAGRYKQPTGKAKSVIFLWMGGGVTHHESFDPKPEAPEEIRGTLDTINTALPGVHFAEAAPNLAKIADDIAWIRSFSHDSNDHFLSQVYTLSGRKVSRTELFKHPNIGAIVSHQYGPRKGLPGYIAIPGITFPGPPPTNLFVGGWLGNEYSPFAVGGRPDQPDFTVGEKEANPTPVYNEDLSPKELRFLGELSSQRLSNRAQLRERLDATLRAAERSDILDAVDGHYQSAFNLLTSPTVRDAFDVSKESEQSRETYGKTKIGGRCLMARWLVEAGARFVMVDYGYDPDYGNLWDNHAVASQKQPHISEMAKRGYHVAGMDKAFAALITDLKQRGMLDDTLVVFLTEFGRTPKINVGGGRDHWGACGSLFMTGAGTKVGQVIGASDKQGAYPTTKSYTPADIAATIYTAMGLDPETRVYDRENRPHHLLDHGTPMTEIL